jgi:hypothetical protein
MAHNVGINGRVSMKLGRIHLVMGFMILSTAIVTAPPLRRSERLLNKKRKVVYAQSMHQYKSIKAKKLYCSNIHKANYLRHKSNQLQSRITHMQLS